MTRRKTKANGKTQPKTLLKLDLGCGQNCKPGFEGVDFFAPEVKHKLDLFKFPWPFEDESVEEIHCSHFFEHVPNNLRFQFMDEVWRILVPRGKAIIITPYWASPRAFQDPTHQWPPICESSYLYFWKKWRVDNKLDHYPVNCDFDFVFGYAFDPEALSKNQETISFWVKHYLNVVTDLHVTIEKHTEESRKQQALGA